MSSNSELYKVYKRSDGRRVIRVLNDDLRDLMKRNHALEDLAPVRRMLPSGKFRAVDDSEYCNSGNVGDVIDLYDQVYDKRESIAKDISRLESLQATPMFSKALLGPQ